MCHPLRTGQVNISSRIARFLGSHLCSEKGNIPPGEFPERWSRSSRLTLHLTRPDGDIAYLLSAAALAIDNAVLVDQRICSAESWIHLAYLPDVLNSVDLHTYSAVSADLEHHSSYNLHASDFPHEDLTTQQASRQDRSCSLRLRGR